MTDLFQYFSGIKGRAVSGEVEVPFLVSKEGCHIVRSAYPIYYSDSFFEKSACSYNHALAVMSLGMSMAAFTKPESGDRPIRSLLFSIGCDERYIETKKFDTSSPTDDSCAYAFGTKKLPDGSYLIAIVIRSHKYGGEWVSNAHVVDESCPDFAAGFKNAADKVFDALSGYMALRGLDGKHVRVWISGFSRGGAIANLLGARLTLEECFEKDCIYTYTFATPNTVFDRAAVFTDNIFNIVSEIDTVPRVPPASWGFRRYGTDLYLPCKSRRGEEEYAKRLEAMRASFSEIIEHIGIDAVEYMPLDEQEKALDLLFDYIDDLLTGPEKYASEGYQSLLMDYMAGVLSGSKTEFRRFVYFFLRDNRELADDFCAMLEQWNSLSGNEKAHRISVINLKLTGKVTKEFMAYNSPATDIISIAFRVLVHYAAKLTKTKITRGTQDYYYEQLVHLLVDTFQLGACGSLLMQHWSETYLAWMLSGTERELFATTSYQRVTLK